MENQEEKVRPKIILSWRAKRRIRVPKAIGEGANKAVREVAKRRLIVDRRSIFWVGVCRVGPEVRAVMSLISRCKGIRRFILHQRNVNIRQRLRIQNGGLKRNGDL